MHNHTVDTHISIHSRISQRSGLLSGYVGSTSISGLGWARNRDNIRLALFLDIFSLFVFGAFAFLVPTVAFA
jgi:hypothetical protein